MRSSHRKTFATILWIKQATSQAKFITNQYRPAQYMSLKNNKLKKLRPYNITLYSEVTIFLKAIAITTFFICNGHVWRSNWILVAASVNSKSIPNRHISVWCRTENDSLFDCVLSWSWNVPFTIEDIRLKSLLLWSVRPIVLIWC